MLRTIQPFQIERNDSRTSDATDGKSISSKYIFPNATSQINPAYQ